MHTLDVTEFRYVYRIVLVRDGTRLCGDEYAFHFKCYKWSTVSTGIYYNSSS